MGISRSRGAVGTLSYSGALVLQAIVDGHRHGFDMMRATRLPSGSVYPLLRRLEAAALVDSDWERASEAHPEGRPQRRYYRATPAGRLALRHARERLLAQQALLFGFGRGRGMKATGER
jgi:PadR family transcriptional regulator PadR